MTERHEPVDPRHEQALAAALRAEAESVRTAGDGLVRIRARVERRRMRNRLLVPIAGTAAVAATVTAVVATGILAGSGKHDSTVVSLATTSVAATTSAPASLAPSPKIVPSASSVAPSPSVIATTTTAPSPSSEPVTTTVVGSPVQGPVPVWPFADMAAADTWQAGAASSPDQWHLDPRGTAERFVASVVAQLGLPKQGQLTGTTHVATDGTTTVDVIRTEPSTGAKLTVGTVRLSHWSTGVTAPWGVVAVTAAATSELPLKITSPGAEQAVAVPMPVSFDLTGAEDDVYVSAVTAGGASMAPAQHVVTGAAQTVTLPATVPLSGRGYVVVADGSTGQGAWAMSRLAVTPVDIRAAIPAAPTYVALVNGTLRVYDTTTDAEVRRLAPGVTGITQVTVGQTRDWVYFLAPGGFLRTRLDGSGQPGTVTTADKQHTITALDIAGTQDERLAYVAPSPAGDGQWIYWSAGGDVSGQIQVSTSLPPQAQSVAISPDGRQLSAFVRTGMLGNVLTFDLGSAKVLADGVTPAPCRAAGNECVAAGYAPNGDLLLVRSDGVKLTVLRMHDATATTEFAVTASSQTATVDTDPTGTKVLLTDGTGHAWSWSGSGAAKPLAGSITGASW
jgi:hypothetical protein